MSLAAGPKGTARDTDHPLLLQQPFAEIPAGQAEGADVRKQIERARRAVAAEPLDLPEARQQMVTALGKFVPELRTQLRMLQRRDGRTLAGGIGAERYVFGCSCEDERW